MKCLVKYMSQTDVLAEACWAPSYEENEFIDLDNHQVKVLKRYDTGKNEFKYLIKVVNAEVDIPEIIADEDALIEGNETKVISFISNLIANKKFEINFTKQILNAIYKKSK